MLVSRTLTISSPGTLVTAVRMEGSFPLVPRQCSSRWRSAVREGGRKGEVRRVRGVREGEGRAGMVCWYTHHSE